MRPGFTGLVLSATQVWVEVLLPPGHHVMRQLLLPEDRRGEEVELKVGRVGRQAGSSKSPSRVVFAPTRVNWKVWMQARSIYPQAASMARCDRRAAGWPASDSSIVAGIPAGAPNGAHTTPVEFANQTARLAWCEIMYLPRVHLPRPSHGSPARRPRLS